MKILLIYVLCTQSSYAASVSRPRDENREDKKVRKQALKAERKVSDRTCQ